MLFELWALDGQEDKLDRICFINALKNVALKQAGYNEYDYLDVIPNCLSKREIDDFYNRIYDLERENNQIYHVIMKMLRVQTEKPINIVEVMQFKPIFERMNVKNIMREI